MQSHLRVIRKEDNPMNYPAWRRGGGVLPMDVLCGTVARFQGLLGGW